MRSRGRNLFHRHTDLLVPKLSLRITYRFSEVRLSTLSLEPQERPPEPINKRASPNFSSNLVIKPAWCLGACGSDPVSPKFFAELAVTKSGDGRVGDKAILCKLP